MASYHLKFDGSAASSVDAYLEYKRIVGDDDGGVMFTPKQYEAYKKKVLPMRMNNRIFVSWTSPTGMDCKLIGPETNCFCGHRYHQHKTDFEVIPEGRPIPLPCQAKGCRCSAYHYSPQNGTQPVRCTCKHFPEDHSTKGPYLCQNSGCKCGGFRSAYTCGCGAPSHAHTMVTETKEERQARGHPIGQDVGYKAMGGLTGFSSLMDGYLRLDPSGSGAPSDEFLNMPITSSDHPFLKGNVNSIRAYKQAVKASDVDADLAERMSAMKKPGESDMDFYERRYQERLKAEKAARRAPLAIQQGGRGSRIGMRKPAAIAGNMEATGSMSVAGTSTGSSNPGTKGRGKGRGSGMPNYLVMAAKNQDGGAGLQQKIQHTTVLLGGSDLLAFEVFCKSQGLKNFGVDLAITDVISASMPGFSLTSFATAAQHLAAQWYMKGNPKLVVLFTGLAYQTMHTPSQMASVIMKAVAFLEMLCIPCVVLGPMPSCIEVGAIYQKQLALELFAAFAKITNPSTRFVPLSAMWAGDNNTTAHGISQEVITPQGGACLLDIIHEVFQSSIPHV